MGQAKIRGTKLERIEQSLAAAKKIDQLNAERELAERKKFLALPREHQESIKAVRHLKHLKMIELYSIMGFLQ